MVLPDEALPTAGIEFSLTPVKNSSDIDSYETVTQTSYPEEIFKASISFPNISNKAIRAKAYKDSIVRSSAGAAQSVSRSYAIVGIEVIKKMAVSLGNGVEMALVITSSLSEK